MSDKSTTSWNVTIRPSRKGTGHARSVTSWSAMRDMCVYFHDQQVIRENCPSNRCMTFNFRNDWTIRPAFNVIHSDSLACKQSNICSVTSYEFALIILFASTVSTWQFAKFSGMNYQHSCTAVVIWIISAQTKLSSVTYEAQHFGIIAVYDGGGGGIVKESICIWYVCHDAKHVKTTADLSFVVQWPINTYMNVLHANYAHAHTWLACDF